MREPWRTRSEAWNEYVSRHGDRLSPLMLDRARVACELDEWPWSEEQYLPEDAPRPAREPLVHMRAAYQRLLPELGGLSIKAQHDRVLDDLGIKGKADGYGYDLFRKKVVPRRR